ncbi:MAG: hypothetical protein KDH19_07465, partial [Geminicoccaceae bacterium]|nr:hypothetical protein [Geminicoccaceae bacterium]
MVVIDISVHEGELPGSGTIIVTAGTDGTLGDAARALDTSLGGLVARMVELGGELTNGKVLDALAPSGSGHDRILVLCLANKE